MPSQLEMLREALQRFEERHGKDGPFAKALQQQIRSLETRELDGPQPNPVTMGKR